MNAYVFYSKSDSTKEPINTWPAKSLEEARERFAQMKRLSIDKFDKLYIVERNDRP